MWLKTNSAEGGRVAGNLAIASNDGARLFVEIKADAEKVAFRYGALRDAGFGMVRRLRQDMKEFVSQHAGQRPTILCVLSSGVSAKAWSQQRVQIPTLDPDKGKHVSVGILGGSKRLVFGRGRFVGVRRA